MAGNMTKLEALDWLVKYGAVSRGYPEEPAAAYVGLGVERFRKEVAAGRLPEPERYGKRLVWDKLLLDHHMNKLAGNTKGSSDPIMASIHAAKSPSVRRPSSS
jgi:hypothetical protein